MQSVGVSTTSATSTNRLYRAAIEKAAYGKVVTQCLQNPLAVETLASREASVLEGSRRGFGADLVLGTRHVRNNRAYGGRFNVSVVE